VRMNTDAREALASYEVRVASGAVPQKAVFVFETETPVVRAGAELSSPLLGVHRQYVVWQEAMAQLAVTGEWNRVKHLAVTERIEVKDQTTSGIQLLDEQRRCVPSSLLARAACACHDSRHTHTAGTTSPASTTACYTTTLCD